jgi:hypothetical protein
MGGGGRERVELAKVKYIHSGDTLETPLNLDLGINNERTVKYVQCVWRGDLWEGGE